MKPPRVRQVRLSETIKQDSPRIFLDLRDANGSKLFFSEVKIILDQRDKITLETELIGVPKFNGKTDAPLPKRFNAGSPFAAWQGATAPSPDSISKLKLGHKFPSDRGRKKRGRPAINTSRDIEILKRKESGESTRSLAEKYGLSLVRVRQIVRRMRRKKCNSPRSKKQ